jgi:hypothetical protein
MVLARGAIAQMVLILDLDWRRSANFGFNAIGDGAGSWSAHIRAVIDRHDPARATSESCRIRDSREIKETVTKKYSNCNEERM